MGATDIKKSLDELMQACDKVEQEADYACELCPLYHNCLKVSSIEDIWSKVSEPHISQFLEFADKIEDIIEDEEYRRELERQQEQREYEAEMKELFRGWRADRGI